MLLKRLIIGLLITGIFQPIFPLEASAALARKGFVAPAGSSTASKLKTESKRRGEVKIEDLRTPKEVMPQTKDSQRNEMCNLHIHNDSRYRLVVSLNNVMCDILTPGGDAYFILKPCTVEIEAFCRDGAARTSLAVTNNRLTSWTIRGEDDGEAAPASSNGNAEQNL
jgi:hypothetical protein